MYSCARGFRARGGPDLLHPRPSPSAVQAPSAAGSGSGGGGGGGGGGSLSFTPSLMVLNLSPTLEVIARLTMSRYALA